MLWYHRSGRGLQSVWCNRDRTGVTSDVGPLSATVNGGVVGVVGTVLPVGVILPPPLGSMHWHVWTHREVASEEVFVDCMAWWSGNHWDVLPEEVSIPECHTP